MYLKLQNMMQVTFNYISQFPTHYKLYECAGLRWLVHVFPPFFRLGLGTLFANETSIFISGWRPCCSS